MVSILGLAAAAIVGWYATVKPAERPTVLVTGSILLAVLGYASFRYAHAWADEESLWPPTIAGHPTICHVGCGCWQAHNRLGAKKMARGDLEAAHYHFQNATRLRPELGETHNNLGTSLSTRAQIFAQRGDQAAAKREMDAALEQFAEACRVTPNVSTIQLNFANALANVGRLGEACAKYEDLIAKEPNNAALVNNYAATLYRQGRKEEAIVQFRRALALAPTMKEAREGLAIALGEKPDATAGRPPTQPPVPPQGDRPQPEFPPAPATLGHTASP